MKICRPLARGMTFEGWLIHGAMHSSRGVPLKGTEFPTNLRKDKGGFGDKLKRALSLPPWQQPLKARAPSARDEFYRRMKEPHNLERPNGTMEMGHRPVVGPSFRRPVTFEPMAAHVLVPSGYGLNHNASKASILAQKRMRPTCWDG